MARSAASTRWKPSRAIREAGGDTGVDVVVFCDEEGHFGSFLGSKSFTGVLTEDDIDKAKNKNDGTPLREALKTAGYAGRPRLAIEPERYKAFFEAHIEQGDSLEMGELRIGVVTAIVAIWQYGITVTGEQNHAGTTSMLRRRDAGLALIKLLNAIDKRFPEICGPRTRVDHRAHHARSRQPQHHSGRAPRRCSSCAMPIRRCSTSCTPS